MKKWNTPEIAELNIDETANGFLPLEFEGTDTKNPLYYIFNDKGNSDSSTPEADDVVNPLS